MEFLVKNLIQTTTALSINNGTLTVANLLSSDERRQFKSDGDNSDTTITSISVTLDATTTVDRIILREMNFKGFRLYYDGVTANAFNLSGADTSTSVWSTNSQTSMFLRMDTTTCKTITLECTQTMVADREKALGQLIVSRLDLTLSRMPSAKDYDPLLDRNEVAHELSDGGQRIHFVRVRHGAKVKLKYVSESLRNSLRTIFKDDESRIFCPFGTSTGWDGFVFDAVWVGAFDFFQYADDAVGAGFTGTINLKESHV